MIASKLACFLKQTNIFIQRKMMQATNSAMRVGIYHIAHARAASRLPQTLCSRSLPQSLLSLSLSLSRTRAWYRLPQNFKLCSTTEQMPALVYIEKKFSFLKWRNLVRSHWSPYSLSNACRKFRFLAYFRNGTTEVGKKWSKFFLRFTATKLSILKQRLSEMDTLPMSGWPDAFMK
jgi:hypothetical protein